MKHESGGRFRRMSGYVRTQSSETEVRAVVHESAVLQSKRDMADESVIHASAINKCRAGLPQRPGNGRSAVACGIKHERSRSGEHVGPHPGNINRKVDDQRSGRLMHVGLNAEVSSRSEILLRVAIVAVARVSGEPAVDMKAVVHQEAAGIGGMLQCTVLLGIFGKKPGPLHTD